MHSRFFVFLLVLIALLVGGVSFLMFASPTPASATVEKPLENARFFQ